MKLLFFIYLSLLNASVFICNQIKKLNCFEMQTCMIQLWQQVHGTGKKGNCINKDPVIPKYTPSQIHVLTQQNASTIWQHKDLRGSSRILTFFHPFLHKNPIKNSSAWNFASSHLKPTVTFWLQKSSIHGWGEELVHSGFT